MNGEKGLEQLASCEIADETTVCGQKIVLGKFLEFDPFELVEDFVLKVALELWNSEELQIDSAAMAVVVANVGDVRADGGSDAEFFLKFALERLLRAFAGFDFAAGELPLEGHGLIRTPLADQNQAVLNQQSRNHETKCRAARTRVGDGLRLFHTSSVNALQPRQM